LGLGRIIILGGLRIIGGVMDEDQRIPLDVRLLEPFVVLAEELHFTRAAERLHVAQPALSQQIARLEQQIGMRLFTRPPEAVRVTPAGQALLARVRPALAAIRTGVGEARSVAAGDLGTLGVAHLSSLAPRVVPAIIAAFHDECPMVSVLPREASVEEQLGDLRDGEVDVGLFHLNRDVKLDGEGAAVEVVASGCPRYAAVRPDHRIAGWRSVALGELAGESWIMPSGTGRPGYQAAIFLATCRRSGFEPRVVERANSIETMLGLVTAGLGIALAPWAVALSRPGELVLVEIEGESLDVVAVRTEHSAAASEVFIAVARAVVARLLEDLA